MQERLNAGTSQFNVQLAALLDAYPGSHPGAIVLPYDTLGFYTTVRSNASAYGFTNINDPCYMASNAQSMYTDFFNFPICSAPDQHFFWDLVRFQKLFSASLRACLSP